MEICKKILSSVLAVLPYFEKTNYTYLLAVTNTILLNACCSPLDMGGGEGETEEGEAEGP